jgi:DNA-binding NtrC family response regulator
MSARAGVSGRGGSAPVVDDNLPLSDNIAGVVGQVERAYLCRCLERHAGHLGKTAEAAGITRRTLYTKLKHLGVDAADYRH